MQGKFGSLFKESLGGFVKKIPIKYHKIVSIVSGVIVAASPLLFNVFKKKLWLFFVMIGLAEIMAALFTEKEKGQRTVVYASL